MFIVASHVGWLHMMRTDFIKIQNLCDDLNNFLKMIRSRSNIYTTSGTTPLGCDLIILENS